MHTDLLISLKLKANLKIVCDMAFDSMDEDGSQGLNVSELQEVMDRVAIQLGITGPTDDDLEAILMELDDDYD